MTPVNIPVPKPVIKISDESIQTSLSQKIFFSLSGKIALGTGLTSQRFTVTDFLQVVKTAGNTLIAVRIEGIKADAGSAIHAGVNLGTVHNRVACRINNSRSSCAVGIDEVGIGISWIIRSFNVTVTQRSLDD